MEVWTHPGITPRWNGAARRMPSGFQITTMILLALGAIAALVRWPQTAFPTYQQPFALKRSNDAAGRLDRHTEHETEFFARKVVNPVAFTVAQT